MSAYAGGTETLLRAAFEQTVRKAVRADLTLGGEFSFQLRTTHKQNQHKTRATTVQPAVALAHSKKRFLLLQNNFKTT